MEMQISLPRIKSKIVQFLFLNLTVERLKSFLSANGVETWR